MKARELIAGAPYAPDALKVITKAFDDAWIEIEPTVTGGTDRARLSLANIVLSIAKHNRSDPEQLKDSAVRVYGLTKSL